MRLFAAAADDRSRKAIRINSTDPQELGLGGGEVYRILRTRAQPAIRLYTWPLQGPTGFLFEKLSSVAWRRYKSINGKKCKFMHTDRNLFVIGD